jgi:hypothetical protein
MLSALRLLRPLVVVAIAAVSTLAFSAPSQRTFVASYGNDSSANCSLSLPCRSFNAAIAQTKPGGEVVILDTAGYGPMTITQSLKVIGPSGVYGGISVLGGASGITTGITINAGDTDVVTLRGLDISGVPGPAPLPRRGIDILNAGVVHIEKSSIANFTQDDSGCIALVTSRSVQLYVVDSFLRECNAGIGAFGNVATPILPLVVVDNTRIENGVNTGGTGNPTCGVCMGGYVGVSLRNSMISQQDFGVEFDGLVAGAVPSYLDIVNSKLLGNATGVKFDNSTAGAGAQISIVGSQLTGSTDLMQVSHSAASGITDVRIVDSYLAFATNGLHFANSATGATANLLAELVRTEISRVITQVDVSATNGSNLSLDIRDSNLSFAATLLRTSGTSPLNVSVIRSHLHHATTAIDHGHGLVQLDGSHVSNNGNDFVNNGSGNIVSNGHNMVTANVNASGFTYITPTVILEK